LHKEYKDEKDSKGLEQLAKAMYAIDPDAAAKEGVQKPIKINIIPPPSKG
jgi:hypothetical protein